MSKELSGKPQVCPHCLGDIENFSPTCVPKGSELFYQLVHVLVQIRKGNISGSWAGEVEIKRLKKAFMEMSGYEDTRSYDAYLDLFERKSFLDDLTPVECDGHSPSDVVEDSLVPALTESLRLCGVEVPEPHLKESASAEVA